MKQDRWEIIILKPTATFLSFLRDKLPDQELPDLNILHSDPTAYALQKQINDDETLNQIERQFPRMFFYEISRWFGEAIAKNIECTFLDFLCCFKFELHSQIVLMESDFSEGQQLLCIKPRSVLCKWIKSTSIVEDDPSNIIERINLSHLVEDSTVVVKNFNQLSDVIPFVKHYYQPLFTVEMLRMCENKEQWPMVNSFHQFKRYFTIEIHTKLIHLQ